MKSWYIYFASYIIWANTAILLHAPYWAHCYAWCAESARRPTLNHIHKCWGMRLRRQFQSLENHACQANAWKSHVIKAFVAHGMVDRVYSYLSADFTLIYLLLISFRLAPRAFHLCFRQFDGYHAGALKLQAFINTGHTKAPFLGAIRAWWLTSSALDEISCDCLLYHHNYLWMKENGAMRKFHGLSIHQRRHFDILKYLLATTYRCNKYHFGDYLSLRLIIRAFYFALDAQHMLEALRFIRHEEGRYYWRD